MSTESAEKTRIHALDLTKAICIILILIWHLQPIDISVPVTKKFHVDILVKEAHNVLYFQLTFLAVPALLIVSLFLFFRNFETGGWAYFRKRMQTLITITIFWIAIQSAFLYIAAGAESVSLWMPDGLTEWVLFFMSGGPSLAGLSASPFYFLSVLVVLTAISPVFAMIARHSKVSNMLSWITITVSLVYFEILSFRGIGMAFFDLKSFLVYVPIAHLAWKNGGKLNLTYIFLLWGGYLLFCCQDIFLRYQGVQFNIYARASMLCGAIALMYSMIYLDIKHPPKVVAFLSRHALGIFALQLISHYILVDLMKPVFLALEIRRKLPMGILRVNVQAPITATLSTVATMFVVYILGKTPLKKFFVS